MKLSDRITVPGNVMARQVGEQTVILDLASGIYFGLDAVGTRIWSLIEEGRSLEEICAALADAYDAPRDEIERDLLDLVGNLAGKKLVDLR